MKSRLVCKWLAVLVLLSVAGCGLFRFEQRAPWRDQAERECLSAGAVKINTYIEPAREVDGPGSCGMLKPFRISALAEGSVGLKSRALLACPMVSVLDQWLIEVVQPAARLYMGTELAEVNLGSYSCRNVNNQWSGNKSEHSYGNAVDVMSFKFEDGRTLTVERGWRGASADQNHYNHLHLDLGRHAGGRQICKPVIKFEPRVTPAMVKAPMSMKIPQKRTLQEEEDNSGEFAEPPAPNRGAVQSTPLPPSGPQMMNQTIQQGNSHSAPMSGVPSPNTLLPPIRPPRLGGLY